MCPGGRSESSTSSSNSEGVRELRFQVVIVCLLCGSVLGMDLLASAVVGLRRKGNICSSASSAVLRSSLWCDPTAVNDKPCQDS